MKTYIVPVIRVLHFGCEVRVRAKNKEDARIRAAEGQGDLVDDSYDWDRSVHRDTHLAGWGKIELEKD